MVLLLVSVKLRSQSKPLVLSALGHFTPVVVTSLAKTPHRLFFLLLLLLLLLLSLLIDERTEEGAGKTVAVVLLTPIVVSAHKNPARKSFIHSCAPGQCRYDSCRST
jgi:hypothetical protein